MKKIYSDELTQQHLKTIIFRSYYLYLKEYFPNVNFESLCERAGLPSSYILDDHNWVSVQFESRLMNLIFSEVKDPELLMKVGAYGVKKHVLGWHVHFFAYNVLGLDTIYENIPVMTALLNKVMVAEIQTAQKGHVSVRLSPKLDQLNIDEAKTLLERFPDYIKNTVGYYSAIPTEVGARKAKIVVDIQFENDIPVYYLNIDYPVQHNSFRLLMRNFPFIGSLIIYFFNSTVSVDNFSNLIISTYFFLIASYLKALYSVKKIREIKSQTQITLNRIDNQYKLIQESQEQLKGRLQESKALNDLVQDLILSRSEIEMLNKAADSLVKNLNFDRAIILLSDQIGHELKYCCSSGVQSDQISLFEQMRLKIHIHSEDNHKISNVYRLGTSILISDVEKHLNLLSDEESKNILLASKTKSFVAVPIRTAEKSYGVLIADCYSKEKLMTESDKHLLTTVGKQLGISIARDRSRCELLESYNSIGKLAESYSRFVPWESLRYLNYDTVFDVKLGDGAENFMTIMFSDIRDFTTLCETMSPSDTLKFLNSVFGCLSPIIKKNEGNIDKFMGDCIMAIFPNPVNAITAALEMQQRLVDYNIANRTGNRNPLSIGIGICHGPVIVGPMGYDKKIEITVLSDTVNIASRLDGLCKAENARILIAGIEPSNIRLPKGVHTKNLGNRHVKGKDEEIRVIEIIDTTVINHIDKNLLTPEAVSYVLKIENSIATKTSDVIKKIA